MGLQQQLSTCHTQVKYAKSCHYYLINQTPFSKLTTSHFEADTILPLSTRTVKPVMNILFKSLGFNNPFAKKLVGDEHFKNVELYYKCNEERCIDTMKVLYHPGGTLVGESVSAMACNNFRIGGFLFNIWERMHRFSKKVGNIFINTNLSEQAERQAKLEKDHCNKLAIEAIVPIRGSDAKNYFVKKLEDFVVILDSIRGCIGVPFSCVPRKETISKNEANDNEDGYAPIDRHMI